MSIANSDPRGIALPDWLDNPAQIRLQRKSNSGQLAGRTWRSVHGVMTVRAADTLLRARIQAWMDELRARWT